MERGEVWWTALDPTIGSEIQKTRPCVVVSPQVMIDGLRTVIVVPFTSRSRSASFRPSLTFKETKGLILLDQIRTVDKSRLRERMGKLDDNAVSELLAMLRWIFAE
jgi:mRNA interferase MazF